MYPGFVSPEASLASGPKDQQPRIPEPRHQKLVRLTTPALPYAGPVTPVELSRTVLRAVRRAVDEGELAVAVPERAVVERPRPGGCGDYATGIALQLARPAGQSPRQVAEMLRRRLLASPGVARVDITGPGFLNITFDSEARDAVLVRDILRSGSAYGREHGTVPACLRVAPGVRAAVVADAVARILRSQGVVACLRYEDGAGPDPAWTALGVAAWPEPSAGRTDEQDPDTLIRPVPAPADPLPLGRTAARWALLHPAVHDRPRISDDHLAQRESNPLFRVRYAHARTRALIRNAADLGFTPAPGDLGLPAGAARTTSVSTGTTTDLAAGDHRPTATATAAASLLTALAEYPLALATAARRRAADRVVRHLIRTADDFLGFQEAVRILPVGDEKPSAAHRARLALAEATGTVLAGGLTLLGLDAPDTM